MSQTIDRHSAEAIVRGVMHGHDFEQNVLDYMNGHGNETHRFVMQVASTLMAAKCVQRDDWFRSEANEMLNVARRNVPLLNLARELVTADRDEDDNLKGCIEEATLEARYQWLLKQLLVS